MHAVPRTPTRGNWIWLGSGLIPAVALAVIVLQPGGRGDAGAPGPASRSAVTAGQAAVTAGRSAVTAGLAPAAGAVGRAELGRGGGGARLAVPGFAPAPGLPGRRAGAPGVAASGVEPYLAGVAEYYDPGSGPGGCALGPFPAGGFYVSLPPQRYQRGAACGSYLEVRGGQGQVVAEVVDLCPGCAANAVNLSHAAYDRAVGEAGSQRVTFRPAADPPLPGPLVLQGGVTATGLLAVQVVNTGNPLVSVAVATQAGGGPAAWHPLARDAGGTWTSAVPLGPGPFAVRITDNQGHQVNLTQVTLVSGGQVHTTAWMYGHPARAPGP